MATTASDVSPEDSPGSLRSRSLGRGDRRFVWISLALFVALTVLHTWPLAEAPGVWSRNDNGDTVLHEWTIGWLAHQLVTDPRHLFDANIFFPDRLTLAYSDHLLIPGIFAAPVIWAGGSPVLAHNLLLMAGLAFTGWAMSLVVQRWTGSWLAGVMAGSLVAFDAAMLTSFPQLQGLHLEFLAFALLALDRTLRVPRVGNALRLAAWFALQALVSGYWLLFTALAMVVAAAARWGELWKAKAPGPRRPVVYLGLAGLLAGVGLLPFLRPYWIVSRDRGLIRSLDEVAQYSAQWGDYLATGGRLHYALWSHRFFQDDALFPGVVALLLAALAIGSETVLHNPRARMVFAVTVVAFVLSFGPAFPLYRPLFDVFPLMQGVRGASWFGHLVLVGVAILAGFGLAALLRALASSNRAGLRRAAVPVGIVLLIAAHVEALRAPFEYREFRGVPASWDELAKTGDSVLAVFPFPPSRAFFANADYMLASTRSWKPMLNGYSGFVPPSYYEHAAALEPFPAASAIDYLRRVGVTHVVVQVPATDDAFLAAVDAAGALRPVFADADLRIYVLGD